MAGADRESRSPATPKCFNPSMGLISSAIAYSVGRRHGRRKAERRGASEARNEGPVGGEDCANYHRFCKNFGGCDGQVCEPI